MREPSNKLITGEGWIFFKTFRAKNCIEVLDMRAISAIHVLGEIKLHE